MANVKITAARMSHLCLARSTVKHCTGLLIMMEAHGLIVNVVTADVDVEDL
jgi:hypothetical protein